MPKNNTKRSGLENAFKTDVEMLGEKKSQVQSAKKTTVENTNIPSKKKGRPRKEVNRKEGVRAGTHAHLNVVIKDEAHQKVSIASIMQKKSMAEIVEELIEKHLK